MKVYAYGTEINTETDRTIATFRLTDPEPLYQEWAQIKATDGNYLYLYKSSNFHDGYTATGDERDPATEIKFFGTVTHNDIFDALYDLGIDEDEITRAIPDDLTPYRDAPEQLADLELTANNDGEYIFDPYNAELEPEEFNQLVGTYNLESWLELDQRCGNYTRRAQYHSLKAAGYNVDAIDGYFDDDDKTTDDAEQN